MNEIRIESKYVYLKIEYYEVCLWRLTNCHNTQVYLSGFYSLGCYVAPVMDQWMDDPKQMLQESRWCNTGQIGLKSSDSWQEECPKMIGNWFKFYSDYDGFIFIDE